MAGEILSELARQKQIEQHKIHLRNEAALLEGLVPLPPVDISAHREFIGPFVEFCAKRSVRHCPARPATVTTFISDCAYRGEQFAVKALEAIEALHEYHGQSNPTATGLVQAALEKIIMVEPPRSWPKAGKVRFARLPTSMKMVIATREQDRERGLRQAQNRLAEQRKALEQKHNGESKTDDATNNAHERTECAGEPSGASAG